MEFNTERSDKGFFIKILIALVVLALLIGGYFYISKKDATLVVNENNQSVPPLKGLERDLENKLPVVFPVGLVQEKDIANTIESLTYTKEGQKTQYTFRYTSKKNFSDTLAYFMKYLSTNEWHLVGIPTTEKTFASFSSTRKIIENVFITINEVESVGVIVDVTYIK